MSLAIMFQASDRPTESETPTVPPNEAASDTAPANAKMLEVSSAVSIIVSALMPSLLVLEPSPSI